MIFLPFIIPILSLSNAEHCNSILEYQKNVDWNEHIGDLWAWMSAQKSKTVVTFCKNDKSNYDPTDFQHSPIKGKFVLCTV